MSRTVRLNFSCASGNERRRVALWNDLRCAKAILDAFFAIRSRLARRKQPAHSCDVGCTSSKVSAQPPPTNREQVKRVVKLALKRKKSVDRSGIGNAMS